MQAEQSILDNIQRRQLKWCGHLLRMEDLPVDTARQEEKRKTATIMEELSNGLHEMQKPGRRYGRAIFGIWELMDGSWMYRS